MDGAAQGDDNIDALPLEQRLSHKVRSPAQVCLH